MAVEQDTLPSPSPLNCFRNVAMSVCALVALLYVMGVVVENLEFIVNGVFALFDTCWGATMRALSLGGLSVWFSIAGATLSASVAAWAACVYCQNSDARIVQPAKKILSQGRLVLVGIVGLVAYYLFFFAMRSFGTQAFETTHRSIAFFCLHLLALAPLALIFLGVVFFALELLSNAPFEEK